VEKLFFEIVIVVIVVIPHARDHDQDHDKKKTTLKLTRRGGIDPAIRWDKYSYTSLQYYFSFRGATIF